MLIVVEGPDGCGKTSVATELAKRLKGECIHFPDDNGITGPIIRQYLRKEWWIEQKENTVSSNAAMNALAFQALQLVSRMEHMEYLNEAANGGPQSPVVVLARYWQSGVVYGQLDGLDPAWLKKIHSTLAKPHLNILLDVDAEESMRRRAARDGDLPPERYEGKLDLTQKVVDLYRELWEENSPTEGKDIRWHRLDTTHMSLPDVIEECYKESAYRLRWLRGIL